MCSTGLDLHKRAEFNFVFFLYAPNTFRILWDIRKTVILVHRSISSSLTFATTYSDLRHQFSVQYLNPNLTHQRINSNVSSVGVLEVPIEGNDFTVNISDYGREKQILWIDRLGEEHHWQGPRMLAVHDQLAAMCPPRGRESDGVMTRRCCLFECNRRASTFGPELLFCTEYN